MVGGGCELRPGWEQEGKSHSCGRELASGLREACPLRVWVPSLRGTAHGTWNPACSEDVVSSGVWARGPGQRGPSRLWGGGCVALD